MLIALALIASAQMAYRAARLEIESRVARESTAGAPDRVSRHEVRLADLREVLPARGVVGYATDGRVGQGFANLDALQDYFMTQYSLAPIIVLSNLEADLIVGNFSETRPDLAELNREGREGGLQLLQDFGGGVVLFTRAAR